MDFEPKLKAIFEKLISGAPLKLAESMRYSLFAPGKRIRPRLTLATSELIGLSATVGTLVGAAIEMIHCFTLIHDDLPCMDNDDFRRGKPSNHKQFGEAIALLAGDALIALAWDALQLTQDQVDPKNLLKAFSTFSQIIGADGIIGGQAAEMDLNQQSSLKDLEKVHALKTGLLFSSTIKIPLHLSGLSIYDPPGDSLCQFGAALGQAFQVADDLADDLDGFQKNGVPHPPTNILFFKDNKNAIRETTLKLQLSCEHLTNQWGEKAVPLVLIANEIKLKLK